MVEARGIADYTQKLESARGEPQSPKLHGRAYSGATRTPRPLCPMLDEHKASCAIVYEYRVLAFAHASTRVGIKLNFSSFILSNLHFDYDCDPIHIN
ncbi:hypothetical protein EVAR_22125_1 [Eumeta japonica]|uniref:Uncharacterized protein n=1 Tax=Eumeta variegata TaxID=151549 RepID=A0A4C1VZI4_EUMVA|nr:hypothetical protein EVAR_22125_1 [Eumeta japonica]